MDNGMIPKAYQALLCEFGTEYKNHSGETLYQHLVGTYELLKDWGNPEDICVAGLFHSIYGTQWFNIESTTLDRREYISSIIGKRSEELVYLFCTTDRAGLWENPSGDEVVLHSRVDNNQYVLSEEKRGALIEIDVANTVEQLRRTPDIDAKFLRIFRARINTFEKQLSNGAYQTANTLFCLTPFKRSQNVINANPSTEPEQTIGERALQYLLAPLLPEDFVSKLWAKKPLYIPGEKNKFRFLFDLERLEDCLRRGGNLVVRASFDGGRNHVRVHPSDAMILYKAGATICVSDMAAVDEILASFAAAVKTQLNFIGLTDFRAYLSPDGEGYDTHFDSRIATTLQIEGRKRWKFSTDVALDWPHYQVRSGQGDSLVTDYQFQQPIQDWQRFRVPAECSFREVVLEPGDVLCLPAGAWHSAEAIGYSLALNLAFQPIGFWELLAPVLSSLLIKYSKWREPPPSVPSDRVHCGSLPESVDRFFQARIGELIEVLKSMTEDPKELNQAWHRMVVYGTGANTPLVAVGRKTCSLTPDDRIRVTKKGVLAYGFGPGPSGEKLVYVYGATPPFEIGYSENATPFFQHLLAQSEFNAREATRWTNDENEYSWESVKAMLEDMLEHGVIRIME